MQPVPDVKTVEYEVVAAVHVFVKFEAGVGGVPTPAGPVAPVPSDR